MKLMLCPRCWGSQIDPVSGSSCDYCRSTGTCEDQLLSPHFWLSEFLASETATRKEIPNEPSMEVIQHLQILAVDLLEPVRDHFGPIKISSGYRSPALNANVGGSSSTSVHPKGHAADFSAVMGATRKQIVDYVIALDLPYDQVIFEGTWVHIGRFGPSGTLPIRKEKLMMFANNGPKYYPYDPTDPRITT